MADCEATTSTWRGHTSWHCQPCRVNTIDEASWKRLCKASNDPQVTTTSGLYGPTGDPLPEPDPEDETPEWRWRDDRDDDGKGFARGEFPVHPTNDDV